MPRPIYINAAVNRADYNGTVPTPWVNAGGVPINGGSWWDAEYKANGSIAWASEPVTDTDTVKAVNFNVTKLFQAIYDNPNHLSAVIVCSNSGGTARWALYDNADHAIWPTITYDSDAPISIQEDTGILNASAGGLPSATTLSVSGDLGTASYDRIILNVPPPTNRPVSATLTLTTVAQFGTTVPLIFWLRYPPESAPNSGSSFTDQAIAKGIARGIERGIV